MAEAHIAALVLAAGQSTRMGASNKLLAEVNGEPMVRVVCRAALASQARPVIVVTGHDGSQVRGVLQDLDLTFVENRQYRDGLSTSLRAGVSALPDAAAGVVVLLGDMPWVTADDIDRVIAAFAPHEGREIIVPTHDGRRGNPVLWSARFLPDLTRVTGDQGGRALLAAHADVVHHVAIGRGVVADVDRPGDLAGQAASPTR